MKYLFLLLTIATLSSCDTDDETQSSIIGEWRWVETYNPWGGISTPETSNEDWTLTIDASTIVSHRINNTTTAETETSGSYTIEIKASIFSEDPQEQIISDDPMLGLADIAFDITSDTLSFYYECFDCPNSTFVRK